MVKGIILIVVDCLRADHVSCYGYSRPTTPTFDALAERGVRWERASSTSSWTKPSVTSMLTGLYPTQHGAFQGIKRSKISPNATSDVLRSPRSTLAERLTEAGWACGAFLNNGQLGRFTRLDRGFDTYIPSGGKADNLIAAFTRWLDERTDRPVFAYFHFLETHYPYKPRRRHIALFGGDRDTNRFRDYSARDYGRLRRAIGHGESQLSVEHLEQMVQMYDGAIRRLDGKLKELMGLLRERERLADTAVVVTADHGEEFLDHGRIGHGHSLFEESTHVPLVAVVPGGPTGVRRPGPVSLVDLARTLEGLARPDCDLPGQNLLDFGAAPRPVASELLIGRRYIQSFRDGRWKLHRTIEFSAGDEDGTASRPPRDRVRAGTQAFQHKLFDLESDPGEQRDLAESAEAADTRRRLHAAADRWWDDLPIPMADDQPSEVEVDDVVVQRLRDLGYLE